jgi:GNAT superfamily N-acetyltransferase
MTNTQELPEITLRPGNPADSGLCGKICFEAFESIARQHNFPPDFPSVEVATGLLTLFLSHPGFFGVVAEADRNIVGSNFLDERNMIAGVGPITVDPRVQNLRIGRRLMQAVLDRAAERKFPGVRLLQSAYHSRSLSLYASLGFLPREPIACMQGPAIGIVPAGFHVRPALEADLEACNRVCFSVHGHDRAGETLDAIKLGTARVVEFNGRITGYATDLGFLAHAVGETNRDLMALIGTASAFTGPGILVPIRNAELFRWCLSQRLRVVQVLTLMTIGLYNEPADAYLPSVLY